VPPADPPSRPGYWKWLVCGLLLCASMLLYMDRQTLPNVSVLVTTEFKLSKEQYGNMEMAFGYAFAAGAITFGVIADKWSVRWLYPAVVLLWSLMGFATGLARNYEELLACRTLLGLFEAGHWPCALKTTQGLLAREQRTMGNSVLQSGASFGAIFTPLLMNWMLAGRTGDGVWRTPFLVIGSFGLVWMVLWFALLRKEDFEKSAPNAEHGARNTEQEQSRLASAATRGVNDEPPFLQAILNRRFLALVVVVACINVCWQLIRAWLPMFLEQGRGYTGSEARYFNSFYYIATDVGCLAAGAATLWLAKRGLSVHASRATVFGCCALLCSLTGLIAWLPRGWVLLGVLLVVAAGSLGLFPCYYSFSQELSTKHQGKVTGTLGFVAWAVSSPLQPMFGKLVDQTGSFDMGIALAGLTPLVGFAALRLLWGRDAAKPAEAGGAKSAS